jgi:hypothetical protein
LGATGEFPDGKIDPTDEGGLQIAIAADPVRGLVRLDFGKRIAWLALRQNEARALAASIAEKAEESHAGPD